MPLTAQTWAFMKRLAEQNIPLPQTVEPTVSREIEQRLLPDFAAERALLAECLDFTLPGPGGQINARLYRPAPASDAPAPLLVYFHGGGFVLGNLDTHDGLCCQLASQSGMPVVAVDYRLAPEHPFPAALDDCEAATRWLASHADTLGIRLDGLALAGDSAGAALAAVTSRRLHAGNGPEVALQLLFYPVVDLRGNYPSRQRLGKGYVLTADMMDWFGEQFMPDPALHGAPDAALLPLDPTVTMPVTHVVLAEFDPLIDEGRLYAESLAQTGIPVSCEIVGGVIHGFVNQYRLIDEGRRVIENAATALRAAFA